MENAIEQLATELAKVSADEWAHLASQDRKVILGSAWEEISERLAPRDLTQAMPADDAHWETTPGGESRREIVTRGAA